MAPISWVSRCSGSPKTAGYATLTWRPAVLDAISLNGGFESRDSSPYQSLGNPANGSLIIVKTSQGIRENRGRALVTATRVALGRGITVSSMLGVEHASNVGFVSGATRTYLIAQLTYRLAF